MFFNGIFNAVGTFAHNHNPLVLCEGALVGGVALYSLLQDLGFKFFALSAFKEVAVPSSNLNKRINNLDRVTELNTQVIMQLSRTIKDLTNKTSENMAELKEFIIGFYLIVLTGGEPPKSCTILVGLWQIVI